MKYCKCDRTHTHTHVYRPFLYQNDGTKDGQKLTAHEGTRKSRLLCYCYHMSHKGLYGLNNDIIDTYIKRSFLVSNNCQRNINTTVAGI